jgi:pseudaminic acid synthase
MPPRIPEDGRAWKPSPTGHFEDIMNFNIGNKLVGEGADVFIVAELSANHGGSLQTAKATIEAAARAGADAVKLQTYTPDTITIDCKQEPFILKGGTLWDGKSLYELYGEAYTPWEWYPELRDLAHSLGMEIFSSPFDFTAVDFLEAHGCPAYKIASFEIFDIPLIKKAAATGKPIIISTGMADAAEVQEALSAAIDEGNGNIMLLKCTSAYPAPLEAANIATMADMKKRVCCLTGLSDHTPGFAAAAAAVALGADMVEKHFILDHALGGPDEAFSMDEAEFAEMVRVLRDVRKARGVVDYSVSEASLNMRKIARSLYVTEDVKKGEIFTNQNLRSIRPGGGMHPRHLPELLGRKAARDIAKGTAMSESLAD